MPRPKVRGFVEVNAMTFRLPLAEGDAISFAHTVSQDDVAGFAAITTDFSPNHMDASVMRDSAFGKEMVHGALLVGLMSAASTKLLDDRPDARFGATPVSLGFDKVRFLRPVSPGDALRIDYRVVEVDHAALRVIAEATVSTEDALCAVGTNVLKWVPHEGAAPDRKQAANPAFFSAFDHLVRSRQSCRAFVERPVPAAILESIFSTAQAVPSGCNAQPWHATLLNGDAARNFAEALGAYAIDGKHNPDFAFPREYRGVYRDRRREAALELFGRMGVAKGDRHASEVQRLRNFTFFGAPHIAVITTEEALGSYGVLDCGIYISTLLLGAEAMGIAAIPQGAPAEYSDFIRDYLGIGSDRGVICSVSFGYADPDHPANGTRTTRADVADAVTWVH
jgi:acyl dehydratase/nitroreductase